MMLKLTGRWLFAFIYVVFVSSFFATLKDASAQGCEVNCLRVNSISLTDLGGSIRGIVKLTDENGSATGTRSTLVHTVWTRPDGTTLDQYDYIGTRLRAEFKLSTGNEPGTYTLTVANATKTGYTFDPDNSALLTKSITIGDVTNQAPTAVPNADVVSGGVPLTVNFDSSASTDPDGTIAAYAWNFGDGNSSSEANPSHTYLNIGNFNATLTVTDNLGATASNSISIIVTENNAGCASNCMSVDKINLMYKAKSKEIRGQVWLVDENNGVVKDALVHAVWILPDGTTEVDQYKNTDRNSRAKFSLETEAAGTYTLIVEEVTKEGYVFDPENSNVLTGTIDISP